MREIARSEITEIPVKDPRADIGCAPLHSTNPQEVAVRNSKIAEFRRRLETLPVKPIRIAIKTKGKILLINPADILAVEAEGNYVLLQLSSESYHLRESISTMAEKLLPYGFIRIHRSVLVNSSWVEEIHPGTTGEYMLRISGGREYMVSRTYKLNLKSLAQSWIGIGSFLEE
ncbi:MAG: LytTR family DNA-binding domain-containing protein [Candidatus Acidiferrum sp.]